MTNHDKPAGTGRCGPSPTQQGSKSRALLAAVSLLGTSLGVTAAPAEGTSGSDTDSSARNTVVRVAAQLESRGQSRAHDEKGRSERKSFEIQPSEKMQTNSYKQNNKAKMKSQKGHE
jgi:hypothetical protein